MVDDKWPWIKYTGDSEKRQERWTAEMSSFSDMKEFRCPHCQLALRQVNTEKPRPIVRGDLYAERRNGELECWVGLCKCDAELVVFND